MIQHYGLIERWLSDEHETSNLVKNPFFSEIHPRSGILVVDQAHLPKIISAEMKSHAKVNIFMSPDALTNDKLLLIVQGFGLVRPGQWSRSLCINESLRKGTIFDYLDIAKQHGMAVIVFNPNHNQIRLKVKSKKYPFAHVHPHHIYDVPGHGDHVQHMVSVYDQFVSKSNAKHIYIVAHSRGGDSVLQLLNQRLDDPDSPEGQQCGNAFKLSERLRAIAFTDSVHRIQSAKSNHVVKFIGKNARNWVTSDMPLDSPVPIRNDEVGCECVSAGHQKHEWTSTCAVESVFKFFIRMTSNLPQFVSKHELAEINENVSSNGMDFFMVGVALTLCILAGVYIMG